MSAVKDKISTNTGLAAFVGPALDEPLQLQDAGFRSVPCLQALGHMRNLAGPQTQAITEAVIESALLVDWHQSYDAETTSPAFMSGYGWFNLVGPAGAFQSDNLRISIGFWDSGLEYPSHSHAPEEVYCVLAGEAHFMSDDEPPVVLRPGNTKYHASNAQHSMFMTDSPLLAMVIWRGLELDRNPVLQEHAA